MDSRLRNTLDGSIGFFWPSDQGTFPDLDSAEPQRGFIQAVGDELQLHTLDEEPIEAFRKQRRVPASFIGAAEHAGLLVLGIYRAGSSFNMGGGRASVNRYHALTVITDPRLNELRSDRLQSAAVSFLGDQTLAWAGFQVVKEETRTDANALVKEATIHLGSAPDLTTPLRKGQTIDVSSYWRVDREETRRSISTGIEVTVTSTHPVSAEILLTVLTHVQNLLSICFSGLLPAHDGRAIVDAPKDCHDDRGYLWNARLMNHPSDGIADVAKYPIMDLNDLGGVDALRRWARLSTEHPRAVTPVVSAIRLAGTAPEVRVLEAAAAIEYWVAAHRRDAAWPRAGGNYWEALALHVGKPFADWCGDVERWATLLQNHYNGLKHDPSFAFNARDLEILDRSARALLTAALLSRVARSKLPAHRIFSDYRLEALGRAVRELLSNP